MKPLLEWTVIGAGPAGIASIGKLLDAGITPMDILWVDPHFTVGDFGTSWHYVNSNTAVEYFLNFYQQCEAFRYHAKQFKDKIKAAGKLAFAQHMVGKHQTLRTMKSLVQLYIDDNLSDDLCFGEIQN